MWGGGSTSAEVTPCFWRSLHSNGSPIHDDGTTIIHVTGGAVWREGMEGGYEGRGDGCTSSVFAGIHAES